MCSTNPEAYKLLEGMYRDLIHANQGGKYFHLSTDEAWFIGKAHNDHCNEAERAKELGQQALGRVHKPNGELPARPWPYRHLLG
jgi:hypothetical protein